MKERDVGRRLVELLLASFVAVFMASGACFAAQINTPSVGSGQLAPTDAPCRVYSVAQSSGTSEVLIVSSAAYISYVVMSTATADGTVYLTLKDTSVISAGGASGSSDVMRLYFGSASQETVRTFSPPPLFTKGVTLTKSAVPEWAAICVRTLFGQLP